MFGTLLLILQPKSKYYAILRTLLCVRRLILLIIGHFTTSLGRFAAIAGYIDWGDLV